MMSCCTRRFGPSRMLVPQLFAHDLDMNAIVEKIENHGAFLLLAERQIDVIIKFSFAPAILSGEATASERLTRPE